MSIKGGGGGFLWTNFDCLKVGGGGGTFGQSLSVYWVGVGGGGESVCQLNDRFQICSRLICGNRRQEDQ